MHHARDQNGKSFSSANAYACKEREGEREKESVGKIKTKYFFAVWFSLACCCCSLYVTHFAIRTRTDRKEWTNAFNKLCNKCIKYMYVHLSFVICISVSVISMAFISVYRRIFLIRVYNFYFAYCRPQCTAVYFT